MRIPYIKCLTLFICLSMFLCAGCNLNTNINSFEWEEISGGIAITKYNGNDKNVIVPSIIDNKKVISVRSAFSGNVNLETLVLSENIVEITEYTCDLSNCDSLKSLTIPGNIKQNLRENSSIIEGLSHLDNLYEINITNTTGKIDIGNLPLYVEKIDISKTSCIVSPMNAYGFWSVEKCPIKEVLLPDKMPLYYQETTYEYDDDRKGQTYVETIYYEKPSNYDEYPNSYKTITESNINDIFLSFFGADHITINQKEIRK